MTDWCDAQAEAEEREYRAEQAIDRVRAQRDAFREVLARAVDNSKPWLNDAKALLAETDEASSVSARLATLLDKEGSPDFERARKRGGDAAQRYGGEAARRAKQATDDEKGPPKFAPLDTKGRH